METLDEYLDRKHEELKLLNGCLSTPLSLSHPLSFIEVVEQKFRTAAALKAEHDLHDWALTETAWAHRGQLCVGPFEFSYDYQRADLDVRGPSFYRFHERAANETIYTSSGMAAISALLLASAQLMCEADILVPLGSYGETLELIESHARHLRLVPLESSLGEVASAGRLRILLFDSCAPAAAFEAALHCAMPEPDLVIFDTTCFSSGSGKIRRAVSWAQRSEIPIVLVRSHTKLDSLGLEYGRLGSAVFVDCKRPAARAKQQVLNDLAREMRRAVRLFGGAALPAHFPPYFGTKTYRALTHRRVAAILRNSRRTTRYFASALACSSAELHFAHGLYVTPAPMRMLDEKQTKQIAGELCDDLSKAGLPLRHAGSFGFDFGAAEWFHDITRNRNLVRIAIPDLPTLLWDQVTLALAQWWSVHEERKLRPAHRPITAPL